MFWYLSPVMKKLDIQYWLYPEDVPESAKWLINKGENEFIASVYEEGIELQNGEIIPFGKGLAHWRWAKDPVFTCYSETFPCVRD